MSNLSPEEEHDDSHMSVALVIGFGVGIALAVVTGQLASNAFADCDISARTFDRVCEANVTLGVVYGFGAFVAVMLQAWVIGKILETNTLVKAIARVTLNPGTVNEPSEYADGSVHEAQDADSLPKDIPGPKSRRTPKEQGSLRIVLMVLGVVHILFVGLTAVVGSFADGGDAWSRLLLTLLHPIGAIAILVLVFVRVPPKRIASITVAILAVNIVADVVIAALIGVGSIKGDWALPLVFSVVPALAIIYAVLVLRSDDEIGDVE